MSSTPPDASSASASAAAVSPSSPRAAQQPLERAPSAPPAGTAIRRLQEVDSDERAAVTRRVLEEYAHEQREQAPQQRARSSLAQHESSSTSISSSGSGSGSARRALVSASPVIQRQRSAQQQHQLRRVSTATMSAAELADSGGGGGGGGGVRDLQCTDASIAALQGNFQRMWQQQMFCDVNFLVCGVRVAAHRAVVAVWSPPLAKLFEARRSGFASGVQGASQAPAAAAAPAANGPLAPSSAFVGRDVVIDGVTPETFRKLLHFMYTGGVTSLTVDAAVQLLEAAARFEVDPLVTVCAASLAGRLTIQNVVAVASSTYQYSAALRSTCLDFMCDNFVTVAAQAQAFALPLDLVHALVQRDDLATPSEQEVYEFVVRYTRNVPAAAPAASGDAADARATTHARVAVADVLLPCVRFPLLPSGYLSDVVQRESLVQQSSVGKDLLIESYECFAMPERPPASEAAARRRAPRRKQMAAASPASAGATEALPGGAVHRNSVSSASGMAVSPVPRAARASISAFSSANSVDDAAVAAATSATAVSAAAAATVAAAQTPGSGGVGSAASSARRPMPSRAPPTPRFPNQFVPTSPRSGNSSGASSGTSPKAAASTSAGASAQARAPASEAANTPYTPAAQQTADLSSKALEHFASAVLLTASGGAAR